MRDRLRKALEKHTKQHRLRHWLPRPPGQPTGLDFSSNDYLGLANHPKLIEALQHGARNYGIGSTSAGTLGGYTDAHAQLEEGLKDWLKLPAVHLFSCGYMANLGVQTALLNRHDQVFQDRDNHASLLDGARLSNAQLKRYPHRDTDHLAGQLDAPCSGLKLIVSDALFSMRGDFAHIADLGALATQHAASLVLDDAHGLGCLGDDGRGSLAVHHLPLTIPDVLVGTFGKAFGSYGAFVAGDALYVESIAQFARTGLFTTMLPPALACANLASLHLIRNQPQRRAQLMTHIQTWRDGAQHIHLNVSTNTSPIQIVQLPNEQAALSAQATLKAQNILVSAIRPPTVSNERCCLRISLSAAHTTTQIERLLNAIKGLSI